MAEPASPRIAQWHPSPDPAAMAAALSARMQILARKAIDDRGVAAIGLAGGSTPMAAYADFAVSGMPWQKVKLALIDERHVPLSDSQSNEANIATAFAGVKNRLKAWQGLYRDADGIAACAEAADEALQAFGLPFDATVVGMGGDGHIASLFAESPDYAAAMDPHTAQTVVPIRFPADAGITERLSMSLPALLKTRQVLICISGDEKRDVLRRCLDGSAPHYAAARFLAAYQGPVDIYWSPA
jgi:6-phosphogluconolactonase